MRGSGADEPGTVRRRARRDTWSGSHSWAVQLCARHDVNIKALTMEQAKQIYFLEDWLPTGAEHLPPGYGEVLFDIKVNGGDGPTMLQHALNVLRPKDRQLVMDGVIGLCTHQAMLDEGKAGLLEFLRQREERYRRLAQKRSLAKFLDGWLARNNDLKAFALSVV
ncbi:MAG: putative peptidoglycan-binding domain-containing protein [Verrucomicrobiaceae bacterium]